MFNLVSCQYSFDQITSLKAILVLVSFNITRNAEYYMCERVLAF